jgi:DNA-binding MarR family transcriptional regulator
MLTNKKLQKLLISDVEKAIKRLEKKGEVIEI